jgi:hypothetical protein
MDLDTNIKYVKKKVEMLKKQEITINKKPYQEFASVLELLFGTIVLILGLILGLMFFQTKRKITKA